jgi:2-keto-4-pentenoate hydratase/2-oxohepta-3-ene-1,7-dioic acid hydratase in catechol pathway
VIGIGKNYAAHAQEMGGDVPTEPLMFLKPNTSVVGPDDPVFYPRQSREVHYEGELAVVIGRICRDVPVEKATDVILGYTVANDVTARDLQRSDVQFTRAKGFDSFCPLGPWIETDLDPQDFVDGRAVRTWLNGDLVQDGSTEDMVFDVPALVAHVSSAMTLLPGDVILTGTPEGVGPMQVGDEVEVSVAGIGNLTSKVAARD